MILKNFNPKFTIISKNFFFLKSGTAKYKNIFFFEQKVNDTQLGNMHKRNFNTFFEFFENFSIKAEILCFNKKTDEIFNNLVELPFKINFSYIEKTKIEKFFLQFINLNNIFLSSNNVVDAYFYNELVTKYDKIPKNILIEKFNLPKDFFSKQLELENKIHSNLWKKIPYKNDWVYDVDQLYVEKPLIPFYENQNLIDLVDSILDEDSVIDWYLGWELKNYYHYELFFFLRDIKLQPMFDFRTITFLRYWTMFFEDMIYWDPEILKNPDETHIYPDYYIYSSARDMLYSYEWTKGYFDYLYDSTRLDHLLFQEDGVDILGWIIDKNFVYLWDYFDGGDQEFDFMVDYGMLNWFQQIKSQLLNPSSNYPSMHTNLKSSYFTSFEKAFYLSFFPDTSIAKGRINMFLDYWTADYNRFFWGGFTYMDGLSLLEILWYQASVVVWGEFDTFTEDYLAYQSIYFLDHMSSLRTVLISLLLKETPTLDYFEFFISHYSEVFGFNLPEESAQYLDADFLFPLTLKQRLSLFNDEYPIQFKIHQSEWLANMFFGYNVSTFVNNHSFWYINFWHSTELYAQFGYNYEDDEAWENFTHTLLVDYSSLYFQECYRPKQYSSYHPYDDTYKYFNYINIYMKYFNEKFTDELGFFLTSLLWGEKPNTWQPILRFNDMLIKYSQEISIFNDSWLQFYSLYKSFDLHIFFWNIGINFSFYDWKTLSWYKIKVWFFDTVTVGWEKRLVLKTFLWSGNIINYAADCPRYIELYILIWLDKIFGLFFDLKSILNSKFFFFIHFFMYKQHSTFEIISTNDFIFLCLKMKKLLTGEFFVVKIFNEPIQSYFELLNEIQNSKIFKYFINFFFKNFFVMDWILVGITRLSFDNYTFNCSILNFFYYGPRPFPIEFYVPFLIWSDDDFVFINKNKVHFPFNIKLHNYFFNTELSFSEYLEKLIILMLVNQAILDDYWVNSETLHNTLCLINDLDFNEPKFIGFSWYLNYVLWQQLYYDNTINFNVKYESQDKKNELLTYNEITRYELDIYKKAGLNIDTEINNIHNLDEDFFNMCTDDLKKVLNFWINRDKNWTFKDA
jgi:hypothetical protein